MIVLGIDPGTAVTGYGVVRARGARQAGGAELVECGVIRTRASEPLAARLADIYEGVRELLARHQPEALAVEDVFYARNVRTTVVLGHARGVVLLAGQQAGIRIYEYPPADIKKTVTGTGAATKEQVQFMVMKLLRLKNAPEPADAADGVAAALACVLRADVTRLIEAAQVIARIAGTLIASDIDRVEIMTAGGVAYAVHIPLSVAETLPRPGGAVELHTALVVREDSWTLYGFATAAERAMFQRVLGTTGVGPALAMNLMSALGGDRLVRAVQENDLATLTRVPRVGKKLAERLVLELRDKLVAASDAPMPGRAAAPAGPGADAVRALVALGYLASDAEKAVFATLEDGGAGDTADLIRKALARVAKRG